MIEEALMTVLKISVSKQCIIIPPSCCSRSKAENTRQVLDYMDKNGRNSSWTACHYNRLNHTEVILSLGDYKVTIFMTIFWPLLVVVIGFTLMKYVKKLRPQTEKDISREDRERVLVLSTPLLTWRLTQFLAQREEEICCKKLVINIDNQYQIARSEVHKGTGTSF